MHPTRLKAILAELASGESSVADAEKKLKNFAVEDLGYARIDHHRHLRRGFPEVIFGQKKTTGQIITIARKIRKAGSNVLISRIEKKTATAIEKALPNATYFPNAHLTWVPAGRRKKPDIDPVATVLICSAGTSDQPVAEEAAITAWAAGCKVDRLYDVGVAGLHRLAAGKELMENARAIVVAAGMEGALASVIGGLVSCPVIAVPTSIGYGASFGGVAALLGMLNSCSPGVVVVNIDNGFGAGMAAAMIARRK